VSPRTSTLGILALFVATRVLVFLVPFGVTTYPGGHLVMTDVNLYARWSTMLAAGGFPVDDPMWQYPPLAAPLFLLSRLAPRYDVGFMSGALTADAVVLAALLVAAHHRGRFGGAWLWAGAAAIIGPVFLTRFDVFPTAAVVLALLVVSTRPWIAGVLLGLGAALKVWPVLAVAALRRSQLVPGLIAAASTLIVTTVAMWFWFGSQSMAFLEGQSQRGLQVESVAALPFVIGQALGLDVDIVFRYGSMELDVAGAGIAGMITTVTGLGVLVWLGLLRLRGRLDNVPGPDVAFAAVLVSVVASRVFSPQYSIWLVGIAAACLATPRSAMRIPTAMVCAAALLTQAIFPPLYTELIHGAPGATALQVLRIALVVIATVLAVASVVRRGESAVGRGVRIDAGQEV
jgi:hypothetical protein